MSLRLLSVEVAREHDVVVVRRRARQIAEALGFDVTDQTRVATAVSELARNVVMYAGTGKVEFSIEGAASPQVLFVRVSDQGPGIPHLRDVLAGRYRSGSGMGLGISGARRLMDQFEITSAPRTGTSIVLKKIVPRGCPVVTPERAAGIADTLLRLRPGDLEDELRTQNQELLRALDDVQTRQAELLRVNRELEDTNRGVVALYAELDERADHLRRADEIKSRFLSNMTHEFRTPVNAILALTALVLDRGTLDGTAAPELLHIRNAAEQLSEIVNDLLDLAKAEAGKVVVRPTRFHVATLFSALRGMLRPLLLNQAVSLVFEDPAGLPPLNTDDSKTSQILRNFVSNALKYTERGGIRVSARLGASRDTMVFEVADTGIGIAPEDVPRIFDEFSQIEHELQRRIKGTGLGLPLSRRLAELLGGHIDVQSTVGVGSTFRLTIPLVYRPAVPVPERPVPALDPARVPVLVVEDTPADWLVYEQMLDGSQFQAIVASTLREADDLLARVRPAVIMLDIRLQGEEAWGWLAQRREDPVTSGVPVVVVTSVDDPRRALSLGAMSVGIKPVTREWVLDQLTRAVTPLLPARVLVIGADESLAALLTQVVGGALGPLDAAVDEVDALGRAAADAPDVIVVRERVPARDGAAVLRQLKESPSTRHLPIVLVTDDAPDAMDPRVADATVVLPSAGLTRDVLRRTLRSVLGRSARLATATAAGTGRRS